MTTQAPTDALRLVPSREDGLRVGRAILEAHSQWEKEHGVTGAQNPWQEQHVILLGQAAILAAPASPLPGGGWPVHIVRANGATVDEQRRAVLKSETYKHGDMVLVWVSEGDLYGNPFVELEQLPAAPTGDAK